MRALKLSAAGLLITFTLSGCLLRQTRENEKLDSWMNTDIHRVVSSWGPPSRVVDNGKTTIYLWEWDGSTHAVVYQGVADAWTDSCREWFDVARDGTIIGWHWKGYC